MPFPAVIDLADVAAGTGGFRMLPQAIYDHAGAAVSSAGDINHDGIADLIIGAPSDASGEFDAGAAYVVFGTTNGFATPVDLDTIAAGTGGFKIEGQTETDHAGARVSNAGDVNGDGFDDLIMSSDSYDYVVYGHSGGFASPVTLDTIAAGTGGFRIDGAVGPASAAGDIDHDGFDDLILGAPGLGGSFRGGAFVVFGHSGGFTSPLDLTTIAAGTGGFVIKDNTVNDLAGAAVSGAGDVNGDGIDDLIIGAPTRAINSLSARAAVANAGAAYVVFGHTGAFASPVDLATVAAGTGGFEILGQGAGEQAGGSVSNAGDVNADGFGDLIIGAAGAPGAGKAYVVFGHSGGFTSPVDLDTVAAGTGGFEILGQNTRDLAGASVSNAGDVNGDGVADLIIGAQGNQNSNGDDRAGAAYVVFGHSGGFTSPVDLDTIAAGTGGFKIEGAAASDYAGISVSAAGDVNHDGVDDLLVGSESAGAYVIFGRIDALFTAGTDHRDLGSIDLSHFTTSEATRALNGDDVVTLSSSQNLGLLFYGGGGNDAITGSSANDRVQGDSGDDSITGAGGSDSLYGGNGNDRLDGDHVATGAGSDSIFGGNGDDSVVGGLGNDRLSGDAGNDFLFGGNGNDALDGDSGASGSGNDSASGGNGNDNLLGGAGNDSLGGDAGNDVVDGGNGNDVILGGAGNDSLTGGAGNDAITGGTGVDHMLGGAGVDRFGFDDSETGTGANRDVITGFAAEDIINLAAIDAKSLVAGDQAFSWIGNSAFSAAGQLHYVTVGADRIIEGSTDADTAPEFQILLQGYSDVPNMGDFIF